MITDKSNLTMEVYQSALDQLTAARDALAAQMAETDELHAQLAQWQTANAELHDANQKLFDLIASRDERIRLQRAELNDADNRADEAKKKLRRARLVKAQGEDY